MILPALRSMLQIDIIIDIDANGILNILEIFNKEENKIFLLKNNEKVL